MVFDARHHVFRRVAASLVVLAWSAVSAHAASVRLAWDRNSESDLAGYVVSYGTQAGVYIVTVDVGNTTTWSTTSLQAGQRYYFAVQAYNSSGLFSPYSNEVSTAPLPAPTLTAVSPATGTASGGTQVVLTGTNFSTGAVVMFGDKAALSTVVVSATTINAIAPPGPAGAVDVRVTNIDGQTVAKAAGYTYVSNVVTISSVSPASGYAKGGTYLYIRGTNFVSGATVYVGGVAATGVRVIGATLVNAYTPAHSAGTVDVRVAVPDGRSGTLDAAFTYVNGKPTATNVSPRKGTVRGGTNLTITGTNFVAGATVTVGGTPATNVQVLGATTITAITPVDAAALPEAGVTAAALPHTVAVTITNPDGQTATLSSLFSYDLLAPSITTVSPPSGSIDGGTTVIVRGAEFAAGAVVTFGGAPATDVVVLDATTVSAVSPPHESGSVDVLVRNPDGLQGVRQRAFTYVGDDPTTDTDGDGMSDTCEDRFGLDPNSADGDNGASGDPDRDGQTNLAECTDGTHPRGFVTRYFAEGVSSTFFTTVFALANPGTEPAHVLMLFMRADGSTYGHPVVVAPHARATVDAASIPAVATVAFSTKIETDVLIAAERTMSWDATGYGAHTETAIEAPATVWYLAEGATHSGFDLFYLVQNPSAETADIEVRYLLPSGPPVVKTYQVLGNSRFNIWVDLEDPRLALTDVSAVVTSTNGAPIIVERSMYLNAGGKPFGAGHTSAGVSSPATRWFLAEGATGDFFDEFVLIANPETTPAQVTASFMLPNGEVVERQYEVAPNSRFNIWVDLEGPQLEAAAVSTTVESTNGVPIIVERTMWWPGPTAVQWAETHNSPGATETGTRWAMAGGEEGGAQGRATFLLLANTSPYTGHAKVTLLFEDGATLSRTFPLMPQSRFNVAVGVEFPEAEGKRFGAVIESLGDAPAELVVERAMYWNAGSQFWAAGTNAVATRLR